MKGHQTGTRQPWRRFHFVRPADRTERECMDSFLDSADVLFVEALTYGHIDGVEKQPMMNAILRGDHDRQVGLLKKAGKLV